MKKVSGVVCSIEENYKCDHTKTTTAMAKFYILRTNFVFLFPKSQLENINKKLLTWLKKKKRNSLLNKYIFFSNLLEVNACGII